MDPLFRVQPTYDLPRLKLLPLRKQPAYRVDANSDSCNLPWLQAALIGTLQQICPGRSRRSKIAEAALRCSVNLTGLQQAHVSEIAEVKGIGRLTKYIGTRTAVCLKAALALVRKAIQKAEVEQRCDAQPQPLFVLRPKRDLMVILKSV